MHDKEHLQPPETKKAPTKTLIDKHMIPTKLTFFFKYALLGSVMPYFVVFLTSIGLTTSQAGFIAGIRTINAFIFGPIWGALADHTGKRKLVYFILCSGTILLLFPLPWIANYVGGDLVIKQDGSNISFVGNETNNRPDVLNRSYFAFNSSAVTEHDRKNKSFTLLTKTDEKNAGNKLFYTMLVAFIASAVFDQPMLGYFDSIAMNVIYNAKQKSTYGVQRVFGSIGFGIANFVAGLAADYYNHPYLSSYTAIFFVLLPSGLIMLPLGLMTIQQGKWDHVSNDSKQKRKIFTPVFKTCIKASNVFFFITMLIMGFGFALNYGFMFSLMEEYMNASKSIMGLAIVVSSIAEIITFPISSRLIRLFGGNMNCIIIGVFSYFFRYLLLSYVGNPWLVLPIQSIHSVGFALFWAAALEELQRISPKTISTTMFAILNGVHFGLANLIANMLGGVIYQKYGGRRLFRYSSFVFLVWGVFMVLYIYVPKFVLAKNVDNDRPNRELTGEDDPNELLQMTSDD